MMGGSALYLAIKHEIFINTKFKCSYVQGKYVKRS